MKNQKKIILIELLVKCLRKRERIFNRAYPFDDFFYADPDELRNIKKERHKLVKLDMKLSKLLKLIRSHFNSFDKWTNSEIIFSLCLFYQTYSFLYFDSHSLIQLILCGKPQKLIALNRSIDNGRLSKCCYREECSEGIKYKLYSIVSFEENIFG